MSHAPLTSAKVAARECAALLAAHGIRHVVASPGSRNIPLIVATDRHPSLHVTTIVDERVAAFYALGYALHTALPVALMCTSGSAVLNYAPAVAEAYYRRIPLIVISADRPAEWIGQDDSQTIPQADILAPIVKARVDIHADVDISPNGAWLSNRLINDTLLQAVQGCPGPVHINIRFGGALHELTPASADTRVIRLLEPPRMLAGSEVRTLASRLRGKRVMVIAGFSTPADADLTVGLRRLAEAENVAVLTEVTANVHGDAFITRIDATLAIPGDDRYRSDVVLTCGGALVSRHIKEYVRALPAEVEHWHIGITPGTVDCFRHLTLRVDTPAGTFFRALGTAMRPLPSHTGYAALWHDRYRRAVERHDRLVKEVPWSSLCAFDMLLGTLPRSWNLHLSNGTPIRYAQLCGCRRAHRTECNRGVSGIDGCTATALGAAEAYQGGNTLLVSGDMSAAYDMGALAAHAMSPRFRMVIVDNDGGGIFRYIASSRTLEEREQRLAVSGCRQPWHLLAPAFGMQYLEADSAATLEVALRQLYSADGPVLLRIVVPADTSAEVLRRYLGQ